MRPLVVCAIAAAITSACGSSTTNMPSEPGGLPNVARIVCTADGTRLMTPAVLPQPEGVHVISPQPGGPPATLSTDQARGWKPGPKPFVLTLPPGGAHLGCMTM